jgi:hypothetical protein
LPLSVLRSLEVFDDLGLAGAAAAAGRRLAAAVELPERPPQPGVPCGPVLLSTAVAAEALFVAAAVVIGVAVAGTDRRLRWPVWRTWFFSRCSP